MLGGRQTMEEESVKHGGKASSSSSSSASLCRRVYRDQAQDFELLAEACPTLEPHLIFRGHNSKRRTIDFSKEESVEQLTKCLLWKDFGVDWERPPRSLIPPVPNRFTYILWIRDLLRDGGGGDSAKLKKSEVRGVDIGTGGTLIYALLGAAAFGWSFLATECCEYSLDWAHRNLLKNPKLKELIEIRDSRTSRENKREGKEEEDGGFLQLDLQPAPETLGGEGEKRQQQHLKLGISLSRSKEEEEGSGGNMEIDTKDVDVDDDPGDDETRGGESESGMCLVGVLDPIQPYDFCMCNPPFFDVCEDRLLHRQGHGGLENELRCPGGERAFVGRMIDDSMQLRAQVKWYTTMIGRKKTLKALMSRLRGESGVKGIRTTTFVCGKTTRWGLAWTFHQQGTQQQVGTQASGKKRKRTMQTVDATIISRLLSYRGAKPRVSRTHSFMVKMKSHVSKELLTEALDKLMWDGNTRVDVRVAGSLENPFELKCTFLSPSHDHILAKHGSSEVAKYAGKCLNFKACIFQYSKEFVSIQSSLQPTHAQGKEEILLFQALLACLDAAMKCNKE